MPGALSRAASRLWASLPRATTTRPAVRLTITGRLALGFLGVAVVALLSGMVGLYNVQRLTRAGDVIAENQRVASTLHELRMTLEPVLEPAQRYVMTGDPDAPAETMGVLERAEQQLVYFRSRHGRLPGPSGRDARSEELLNQAARLLVKVRSAAEAFFGLTDPRLSEEGQQRLGELTAVYGQLIGTLDALSSQAIEDVEAARRSQRATERMARVSILLITATAVGLALLMGVVVGESIVEPIRQLSRAAQRIGVGDLQRPVALRQRDEFAELGQALDGMRRELARARQALEEKALENARLYREAEQRAVSLQAMVREMHHRIKNNLQTVADLLSLSSGRSDDPEARALLGESLARVKSMAAVHELLLTEPVDRTDVRELARRLAEGACRMAGRRPGPWLRIEGEPVWVSSTRATPLALAVHELIQNALRHGLSHGEQGCLEVSAVRHGSEVVVRVRDDGPGLPPGFQLGQSGGLGLRIAQTLVEKDLRGRLEIRDDQGTEARIIFAL